MEETEEKKVEEEIENEEEVESEEESEEEEEEEIEEQDREGKRVRFELEQRKRRKQKKLKNKRRKTSLIILQESEDFEKILQERIGGTFVPNEEIHVGSEQVIDDTQLEVDINEEDAKNSQPIVSSTENNETTDYERIYAFTNPRLSTDDNGEYLRTDIENDTPEIEIKNQYNNNNTHTTSDVNINQSRKNSKYSGIEIIASDLALKQAASFIDDANTGRYEMHKIDSFSLRLYYLYHKKIFRWSILICVFTQMFILPLFETPKTFHFVPEILCSFLELFVILYFIFIIFFKYSFTLTFNDLNRLFDDDPNSEHNIYKFHGKTTSQSTTQSKIPLKKVSSNQNLLILLIRNEQTNISQ